MEFTATLQQEGKTATGIHVPDEVLERGAALDRDAAVELALTALR